MKLLEYQGKRIFEEAGMRVPRSRLVECAGLPADETALLVAGAAAELLEGDGAGKVVVKAQLYMGGRGKAGLIRLVEDEAAASAAAKDILSKGHRIPAILVEEAIDIRQELYLSVSVDPGSGTFVILAASEGGVEIEELARDRPEAVCRVSIDPFVGLQAYQARGLAYDLGLREQTARSFASMITALFGVFRGKDAELAEINPVFVTNTQEILAGDAKLIIDDNSLFRQREFSLSREQFDSEAAHQAALEGIPYLQFDGDISLMCAGAGLATTVFDLVNFEGGTVANYLEFGGPNYHKAKRAMELCLKNDSAVILIVTFGTIARADVMAEGIVDAIRVLEPDRPVITCIRGTGEDEAHRILRAAGLEPILDTEVAVRRAIDLARERREAG